MVTFVSFNLENRQLGQRIRMVLENRHAVPLTEMRRHLGVSEAEIKGEIDLMVNRGEIERLRPVGYIREDHDFFRLCKPGNGIFYISRRARALREVRLAGEAMAWLAD